MTVSVQDAQRPAADERANSIYLDLDTVLLAAHQGKRGIELGVQADLRDGIDRLSEIANHLVVLVFPPHESLRLVTDDQRIDVLREGLGGSLGRLLVVGCPHGDEDCDCAKPGSGLIELARHENSLAPHGGWFIGADQEGVQSGRGAGLSTIRIGPVGSDHLSSVHRPDYEARDLIDAANHILIEELA